MKRLFIIRHCRAEGQEPEAPLTAEGMKQAQELAEALEGAGIEFILSSPFIRAVDTIRPLSERLGKEIHVDNRLQERILSPTHLENWMELLEQTYLNPDMKLKGGESSNEAAARGLEVIREALTRPENTIAIVTHGNLMSLLIRHYDPPFGFREWKKLSNPDVYCLEFSDGRTRGVERWLA